MQEFVIIVAGGSGSRMKLDIPKQFISINGLPVLMHTIHAFRRYSQSLNIILVLPDHQFQFWNDLCVKYDFHADNYTLVAGGETRFHSVKNGLESIQAEEAMVAVHDGVRPVISETIIKTSFETASKFGSAVASVPLKDSIRALSKDGNNTALDRSDFRLVQTPQTFRIDWMRTAFNHVYQSHFTDCASVLEFSGYPIQLTEGSYENIKITTPEDLQWAEVYLQKLNNID